MASYADFMPPILFLGFWLFFCYWISEMSGWRYLAQKYPGTKGFSKKKYIFKVYRCNKQTCRLIVAATTML
ncbi:MAG: hypothetical protein DYG89_11960 [Caldilinea sp. CFX5]|nr:hypothetical protein [Caldilinea sp. CFX5]